jgi:hypothetical protein
MKKKIIYILAFICCLSSLSFKQVESSCLKKCADKPVKAKKATPPKAKKTTTADVRPFHFYLLNI